MNYGFFDYKYNIEGFTSDLFGTEHIVFIILAFLSLVPIIMFTRNTKRKTVDIFLKILSVFVILFEITKVSWESYYDVTTGRGFNTIGLIPVYTCSLYIYTLFVSAWLKGKARDYALSFLTTVSLLCGGIGVVYCNGLNYYPFWTFGAFYSMLFHYSMLAVGVFLLASGYKRLTWADVYRSWIPIVLLSLVAIPLNYVFKADYMQLYSGLGVPLMSTLAEKLGEVGLRGIFTAIMLLTYMPLAAVIVAVTKFAYFLGSLKRK